MAENTTPVTMMGAKLSLSATLPATYDAAGYGASGMVYTLCGKVESYGNHGGAAQISEFTDCDTGEVTKAKGAKNYGNKTITLAHIPADAGQAMLDAAFESPNRYSVKLQYPSGRIHYMEVLVAKNENQDGAANDIQKVVVDLAICRKIVKVAAT